MLWQEHCVYCVDLDSPNNYGFPPSIVVVAEDVQIYLKVSERVKVIGVEVRSPDHAPVELSFQQSNDWVVFTIPEVGVWETVFVQTPEWRTAAPLVGK